MPRTGSRLLWCHSSAGLSGKGSSLKAMPARRIKRYPEQSRERFLSMDELAHLGVALRETNIDPFAVAAIRLLILTGARLREVLHAQWENVDFDRGVIFLPDSKTGKKPHYLNAAALAVLAGIPPLEGNPRIIPGSRAGQPRADLNRPWITVTEAAGLDGLRIHDLRHSFASFAAGNGLGLPIIGKLLGHSQNAKIRAPHQRPNDLGRERDRRDDRRGYGRAITISLHYPPRKSGNL
jgi:integrase